jgi:hypothetical protein
VAAGSTGKLLKSQTTALNEVAARSSDASGPTKSKSGKASTKTSNKIKITEDDEFEAAPDEDDTKERDAALSSPMKGKESRQLTAVSITQHFTKSFLIIGLDSSQGRTWRGGDDSAFRR